MQRPLNYKKATLCFPGNGKSCFACCPPIRQPGYDHIQYRNIVKRMLRENTRAYPAKGEGVFPITGFSCWALGYLDKEFKVVGCLLHPASNGGRDLRFRVDYGKKCARESCPEAKVFQELGPGEREFWLHLTDDLDSFSYSSPKWNPLFGMMGWGADILRLIAAHERGRTLTRGGFFEAYPFFFKHVDSRANAYLLNNILTGDNVPLLKGESFRGRFEKFSTRLADQLKKFSPSAHGAPYTHLLEGDAQFLDYLRLSAGLRRIHRGEAARLKDLVDEAIYEFKGRC